MSKKLLSYSSNVNLEQYRTLADLCAAYVAENNEQKMAIAFALVCHIATNNGVPARAVSLRRTDRFIEISSIFGDEACVTFDARHMQIDQCGNVMFSENDKLKLVLKRVSKWYVAQTKKLVKAAMLKADIVRECVIELGIK